MDEYDISLWNVSTKYIQRKLNFYDKVRAVNGLEAMTEPERELVREWIAQVLKEKSNLDMLDLGEAVLSIEDGQIRPNKPRNNFRTSYTAMFFPIMVILSISWGILMVLGAMDKAGLLQSIVYYLGSIAGFLYIYSILATSQVGYIRKIREFWRNL